MQKVFSIIISSIFSYLPNCVFCRAWMVLHTAASQAQLCVAPGNFPTLCCGVTPHSELAKKRFLTYPSTVTAKYFMFAVKLWQVEWDQNQHKNTADVDVFFFVMMSSHTPFDTTSMVINVLSNAHFWRVISLFPKNSALCQHNSPCCQRLIIPKIMPA